MSDRTSAVLLLSKPEDVNLAYSSSATELLSTLTALVLLMPNVKDACPPISDKTSDAERPSTVVPAIFKKSSSATPVVNLGTFVLAIPNVSVACFASSCVCISLDTPSSL